MSKRVLILLGLGILAIFAGIFLLKYELTKEFESDYEPEPEPEPEPDPEPESESEPDPTPTEKFVGFKKGFTWDKFEKKYKPVQIPPDKQVTPGQPAVYLEPEPVEVTPG